MYVYQLLIQKQKKSFWISQVMTPKGKVFSPTVLMVLSVLTVHEVDTIILEISKKKIRNV